MRAPAIAIALPFLTGAAGAIVLIDRAGPALAAVAAGAAVLALGAAAASALQEDRHAALAAIGITALLAGWSLGTTAASRAYQPPLLVWFDRVRPSAPVVVEGVLREDAALTAGGASLVLELSKVEGWAGDGRPLGGVRLSVGGELSDASRLAAWTAGRTVRAPALLRLPTVYLNPGAADGRRALARRGTVLVGSVKSAALVEVLAPGSTLDETTAAIRRWTRRSLAARMVRDARTAGVTTAVLIGDRSGLAIEDERRLQEAGTYHVIAISGGNIAILAILAFGICRPIAGPRGAAVVTALLLVAYGFVAAAAPSVTRAVTVAVIFLTARALDHRGPAINALAVAAIAAVAVRPVVVLDAGFILSFGATLGILLGTPLLHTWRPASSGGPESDAPAAPARPVPAAGRPVASAEAPAPSAFRRRSRRASRPVLPLVRGAGLRLAAAAWTLGAATICAELALAPVGATLFARVPLGGLALNFAAIPLMTCVQVGGLALLLTDGWWDAAARVAAVAAHVAADGLLRSAHLVDAAPWLVLDVPPPGAVVFAAWYGALLGLVLPGTRRPAAAILVVSIALLLAGPQATTRGSVPAPPLPLRVVVLDVGQGDATVVSLPGGRTLLVDAGGLAAFGAGPDAFDTAPAFDVGERVVAPALRALGVRRLDSLVLTHGDPDHILGAAGLARRIPFRAVWEGVPVPPHPGLRALGALAASRAAVWRTVQAGDRERYGDVEIRVLHPPLPDWERQRVRNDDSIVLEIRLGETSIVLPGDIGADAERALLPRLEPGRLVVLKAPHHGSATSSTKPLLDALRPAAVIFSCGRDNRFGHPHPAVVSRYRDAGSAIFSTPEHGAVFVETDGRAVEVWGWKGGRSRFGKR